MKDWNSAADQVRRRAFDDLIDSLEVDTPFLFDPVSSVSELPDYLDDNWSDLSLFQNHVIDLPGRDANLVRDTLIALCKFFHVLGCSRYQLQRGAMTWSIVDAYHASFLGGRAFCALCGVLSYTVRGRTVLIDFRPEFGAVDHVKRFRREFKRLDTPVRILQPTAKFLEQKDAWSLLQRVCNVIDKPNIEQVLFSRFLDIPGKPVSRTRNKILYDSVFWQWRTDFSVPNGQPPGGGDWFLKDEEASEAAATLSTIFEVVCALSRPFLQRIGVDSRVLGNEIGLNAQPTVLTCELSVAQD